MTDVEQPVPAVEQILEWAETHVEALAKDMKWRPKDRGYGDFWEAIKPQAKSKIQARATAALAFLERFAGTGSRWTVSAHDVFNNSGERQLMESGARAVGDVITEWVSMVRSGQTQPLLPDSFSVRAASSTDLLEQVRALNSNNKAVPAAPIVLAGAALEIALRSAVEELDLAVEGRRGIDAYAKALRSAEVLNRQDMKEVTLIAGLRNDAAHGEHDRLSSQGAVLMEQQVNHFLERLDEALQQQA